VENGDLTQAQADLITAKMKELSAAIKDQSEDLTQEERKAATQEQRDELKQWAEDNNIAEEYLMFSGGYGGHGGPMGGQPPMNGNKTTDTANTAE
jgi:hypothetical protein